MYRYRLLALILFIAFASGANAVTPGNGPGGVGTTDGTSQLELWVKADALVLNDSAPVTVWNDASGHGRALSQSNAAAQPLFVPGALSGQPVVRFTADFFNNLNLPSTGNEFTVVAVIKPTKSGAYQNVIEGQGGIRPMLWIDAVGNYEFNFTSGAVTPVGANFDLVFGVKRNTGPQYSQIYLNGPNVTASGPNNFSIPASQSYTFFNRSAGQAFSGDLAELIIYSTALTASEIGKVGYYLQQKYSLPASFTSPFPVLTGYQQSPATYTVDVAIPQNAPIVSGGTPTGFSVSPPLPAGLVLDPTTGVISGTPTVVAPQANYTIIATFTGSPNSSTQLSLGVTPPVLVGYSRTPAIFTRGRLASPVSPLLRGGPAIGFSVSPALPPGLNLDAQSGMISGTPTAVAPSASYTITAAFSGSSPSSYVLTLEVVELSTTLDISEFMAGNNSILADGDGVFSDWIEIHNYGALPIDLEGWSLTDNAGNLRKWVFPSKVLAPGAYLVVFASGDSRTDPAGNLHTNFKLEATGEYLALVQPDGATIAREFAPAFPAQAQNVSYGTRDRIAYGAYTQPTPGAENGFFNAVSVSVTASPSGRAFTGTLNVTLSAPLSGDAVIRYTVNGTAPNATSPVYSNPIPLSANTLLRTRVYQTGLNPGPESSEVYLRLGSDLQTFSSNLPLVFLDTDGAIATSASAALTGTNSVILGVDGLTGRASAVGTPNYAGRSGLRIRGRSSQSFPQKQFKFETWNGTGREVNWPLLGLPSSSDWVLSSPWSEKSLVRNALAFRTWEKLGWPSLRTRFVEVFINDDGDGQFTYADDYAGIYMLVEAIDLDRVGISGPQNTSNAANITGGFITETGNADDQDFSTTGSGRAVAHKHRDPDLTDLNSTQRTWIRDYVAKFEQALYGNGFTHPVTGEHYSAYTDVDSQVDYKIVREWSRNFDGGSTYSYVPRGGKLTMGPLWDYNWAFGNVNYAEGGDLPGYRTDGWNRSFTSNTNGWSPWWLRFEQDPDWWQQLADRWTQLRAGVLSDAAVNADIDAMAATLGQEAAARHFTKWPQLGTFTVVSPPGYQSRTTYQSEVDYLKNWLRDRSAWIDGQFLKKPVFSRASGQVAIGSAVSITATAGATIYYTRDGSDPRIPGGAVNPAAITITSGANVVLNSSAVITARVKNGAAWSPPARGAFVTGVAASAQNLVISEIAYHPADPSPGELSSDPTLSDDDFEFVELRNVGAVTIDLTGVAFTEGVSFTFPVGTTLAPGAYITVAENISAFPRRYGNVVPVGQYTGNLNNSSDTLVLKAADDTDIARFSYSDEWSPVTDGRGYTLTLRDAGSVPASYENPATWAISATTNGSPGAGNGPTFTNEFVHWSRAHFSAADLANPQRSAQLADPDRDGLPNILEFALGTLPLSPSSHSAPNVARKDSGVEVTFSRPRQVLDIHYVVEASEDLIVWVPLEGTLATVSQTDTMETIRVDVPVNGASRKFFRLRVTKAN